MSTAEERDYFTDQSVLKDPYDYFEGLRASGPVYHSKLRDIVIVTGFEEALEVLKNTDDFSSVNALQGAALPLPFEPEGDDIREQVEAHRHKFIGEDQIVNIDGERHYKIRTMLNRLFSPKRLKENEVFINEYADELVSTFVAKGHCELMNEIATPFVTLVVADLLGVPAEDRDLFQEALDNAPPPAIWKPKVLSLNRMIRWWLWVGISINMLSIGVKTRAMMC